MSTPRRLAAALIAVGMLVALTACGGGDSEKTPSKAAFRKDANAICKKASKEFDKIAAPKSADDLTKMVKDKLVPRYRKMVGELRDLGYPKGEKDRLQKLYGDMDAFLDKAMKDPEQVLNQSGSTIDKRLKEYGLSECVD